MLRRIAVAGLSLALLACTDLPPPPGTGGAGSGGAGGYAGIAGSGGAGGTAGGGGTAACEISLEGFSNLEATDLVQKGVAIGQVEGYCPGVPCEGSDTIDLWLVTTCIDKTSVRLFWDESAHNLDLFLERLDNKNESWAAQGDDTNSETILANLVPGEEYIIQVQAIDTKGNVQPYDLTVTVPE